jgi:glycine/D-amino acid oxidase-like deaminating enzyme
MSKAIVVGAGVFGLSVARELAGRGWSVLLIDRNAPGTAGPSSARLRVLRCSNGADEWYTDSAWRSRTGWLELAAECGRELFVQCGVLLFASGGQSSEVGWEQASLAVLERLGIPVERLAADEVAERFAGMDGRGADFALYEPMGGVLRAREAVLALQGSAIRRGVQLRQATARPAGAGVLVDGQRIDADLVVWTVGTALPQLFPGLTSATEVPEGMVEFAPPATVGSAPGPAWVDRQADLYGLPALDGLGERVGPVNDLDGCWRANLRMRRPDLADQPVPGIDPCAFADMPDRHFLLAAHPEHSHVWLVGGDSGHGFKHGCAWGSYVSDVLEGRQQPLPRFQLR